MNRHDIWFANPAATWVQALPVGNGRLGAMHFGGVDQDHLQLNEGSLWDGHRRDRNNPAALAALPQVQRLLFAGRNHEADALAGQTMLGIPPTLDSYQPLGDLRLNLHQAAQPLNYRRELNLDEGVSRVSYTLAGTEYLREVFASAEDGVIVVRLSCNQPGRLNLEATLARENAESVDPAHREWVRRIPGVLSAMDHVTVARAAHHHGLCLQGRCGDRGVRFAAEVRVIAENGRVEHTERGVRVTQADAILLLTAGATDYRGMDPARSCEHALDAAARKPYAELRAAHVVDYQRLFKRVSLDLGAIGDAALDDRLAAAKRGQDDPGLCVLVFQYLRYLLISASRPGGLPSNLQGIWNDQMKAPWNSDYHPNINLQMNYWPAESCNLPECHLPLFDWMETLVEPGSRTARIHYGARGWVLHHVSDIWGCTTPMDGVWGVWPMGAAWLCRHLWEHYEYSGNERFLTERAYPLMKGAARFLIDFLIEIPNGLPQAGKLVTNPSHSPENAFLKADGTQAKLTYGATMDLEIIHDLFTCTVAAIDRLPVPTAEDRSFRDELTDALSRLVPLQISPSSGRLQEWIEDYGEPEPGHRHISHMYGLHPGEQISRQRTPELAQAAKASLEYRLSHDYHPTGWSLAWIMHLWARLLEPERAYTALKHQLADFTFPNLMANAHGQPQVGDAEGFASGLAEMLLQSHLGEIRLLPALPKAWSNGSVSGLRARGGFTVDMSWKEGRLTQARIQSLHSVTCRIRGNDAVRVRHGSLPVEVQHPEPGLVAWQCTAGGVYEIAPE